MQESYVARMEQAIAHKKYFINIIQAVEDRLTYSNVLESVFQKKSMVSVAILDYGCGSGLLTYKLAEAFPGAQIVGYDRSLDMIEIARERFSARNLQFVSDLRHVKEGHFNYIILSSVLHEVYSHSGMFSSIAQFLNSLKTYLVPRGYIISRDNYVADSAGQRPLKVKFVNEKMMTRALGCAEELLKLTPPHLKGHLGRLVFDKEAKTLFGSERGVKEFLNKLTWGEESMPRESQESLFCLSNTDFKWVTHSNGVYDHIASYAYTDTSYLGYLSEYVQFVEYFPTHLWTLLQLKESNT